MKNSFPKLTKSSLSCLYICIFFFSMVGCGQKGPLYLPTKDEKDSHVIAPNKCDDAQQISTTVTTITDSNTPIDSINPANRQQVN